GRHHQRARPAGDRARWWPLAARTAVPQRAATMGRVGIFRRRHHAFDAGCPRRRVGGARRSLAVAGRRPRMSRAPTPSGEDERLAALHAYGILDTPPEESFDALTRIAAYICKAPIAVINFVDRDRQWFKSEIGLGVRETPLDVSICAHAILQPGLFVVPDTTQDARFADNPLVTGSPHLRFYAGALLESDQGHP